MQRRMCLQARCLGRIRGPVERFTALRMHWKWCVTVLYNADRHISRTAPGSSCGRKGAQHACAVGAQLSALRFNALRLTSDTK